MKDSLRQTSPETTKKQQEDADRVMKELLEEGQASATTVAVSQKKKQAKQAKSGKECHQTVAQGQDAEEQKDNLLQASSDKANDQMFDNRSTASVESHEVLEYPKLSAALFARELERKSVKELREICRIKGIDTATCIDKRDLVDIIVSNPIATAAAADAVAVGLDVLADVVVHSLPSETGLNGLPGVCTGLQTIRGVDSSIEKHWLVQLPDGRKISLKNET